MQIPLSIILDCLEEFNPDNYITNKRVAFSWVSMFPPKQRSLPIEHLYVGKLSEVLASEWLDRRVCCIVLRDRIQDEYETPERLNNLIVLNSNVDLLDLFALIQRNFYKIFDWHNQMNESVIQNRSLQDLLILSEPVIGNYITISDSSFSLMAYTPDLDCSACPTTRFLVKNGYHSAESIAKFRRFNMPEHWSKATDIYVSTNRTMSPYDYINKVVRYSNTYFAHVIMLCNNKPVSQGLIDLFSILVEHLMVCLERLWRDHNGPSHIYDGLLRNLIEDKDLPIDIIHERAQHAGLPVSNHFHLMKIEPAAGTDPLIQRFAQEILDYIPEAKAMLYEQCIVVLVVQPHENKTRFAQITASIEEMLERYNARCGLSDEFLKISELRMAYEQADIALRYGSRQTMLPFSGSTLKGSLRLYSYEQYYPCYLLCGTAENMRMAANTRASRALKTLQEYDEQHDSNNLELLYLYLNNDRRATETANLLHMHRNNVIYRISRIEELIDMDLNDSSTRFRLLLAYETYAASK